MAKSLERSTVTGNSWKDYKFPVIYRQQFPNSQPYQLTNQNNPQLRSIKQIHWTQKQVISYRWCKHITPVLHQLHWLPDSWQVEYKVACLVHQSLSGLAQTYISQDTNLVSDSSHCLLRSASKKYVVTHTDSSFSNRRAYHTKCDRTSATNTLSNYWNKLYLGYSRPQHTVTVFMQLRNTIIYLLIASLNCTIRQQISLDKQECSVRVPSITISWHEIRTNHKDEWKQRNIPASSFQQNDV